MLGVTGYKTKKALKASVGERLNYYETAIIPEYTSNGVVSVVGPDAYRNRKWYANVTLVNGIIREVS